MKGCFVMKNLTKEFIANFKNHLYEEELSENTIKKYLHDVEAFYKYIGNKDIEKIDVLEYKKRLCEKYAPRSVNSILSSINSMFTYCERYDLKVKLLKIQRQLFAEKNIELTKTEYERLLDVAREKGKIRLYYLMQTIASTGLRISELKYVTVEAVNLGFAMINCKGKIRSVLLPNNLCNVLKMYINRYNISTGSVFVTKSGKPLDRSNIWSDIKGLCESAGINKEKVFPHNLRHLFARTYYTAQKDIVRLADILGHSSVNTTRIYTMESGTVHRKQIEELDFVEVQK